MIAWKTITVTNTEKIFKTKISLVENRRVSIHVFSIYTFLHLSILKSFSLTTFIRKCALWERRAVSGRPGFLSFRCSFTPACSKSDAALSGCIRVVTGVW